MPNNQKRRRFYDRLILIAGSCAHSHDTTIARIVPVFSLEAYILVVAGESRRHGMAPAHAMVLLYQKNRTKNTIIRAACIMILSVGAMA